jgi:DNA-binding transcriptional MocR family regulator
MTTTAFATLPAPPYYAVIFSSLRTQTGTDDYAHMAERMVELAQQQPGPWARRAHKMNPSVIREILKVTEKPGIISFAGGLPSPKTFPVEPCRSLRQGAHATTAAPPCSTPPAKALPPARLGGPT